MKPKEIATKLSLKVLFSDNHFSICRLKDLLDLNEITPDSELLLILQALHCVPYSDMDSEFKKWLFDNVLLLFGTYSSVLGFDFQKIMDVVSQSELPEDRT